jgi:hypothetical protein
MAEYHLHHQHDGVKVEGIVLCKMYYNPRNHGPAATTDDDLDDSSGVSLPPEMTSSRGKRRCATMSTPTPRRLGNITRTYTTTPLAQGCGHLDGDRAWYPEQGGRR